ncbi:MAG: 4Fe-4S double cluster binding domain-containing protein [Thermodesulfobacteriota bacterium]
MHAQVSIPKWLQEWFENMGIMLWGAADLREFDTPSTDQDGRLPYALSWAIPMSAEIMAQVGLQGPNQAYAKEYVRVNSSITEQAKSLESLLISQGYRAWAMPVSKRTDPVGIKGDFPHKTAATKAGLGWVGRNCQLVTRRYGPWVRLGTVFMDLSLGCGPVMDRHFCGKCKRCVEACPAGALSGRSWHPGLPRESILDPGLCDWWKKEHYYQFNDGHNCAICSGVCPYGLKRLKGQKQVLRLNFGV